MVRSFPRAAGGAALLLVVLLLAALVPTLLPSTTPRADAALSAQTADRDLDDRKADVQRQLKRADDHLDESSAELREATEELLAARSDLVDARSTLAATRTELAAARALDREMQARLVAAEARLERARADLAQGEADVAEQQRHLRRVVVSSFESGDPALVGLSMVLTGQDPAELTGQMNAASSVANAESAALDRLEAAEVLLGVRAERTEAAEREVAAARQEAADNLVARQALEQQAQQGKQQVADLVARTADARATAYRAKQSDLRELRRLEAERARIERLIKARASMGRGYTGDGGGFLDQPVAGYTTSPFGWRIHPIWGYRSMHDGIDFGAGCGTPIRAGAAGRVLQTYYSSSYGNRVIIDHGVHSGVGVATISNHLSSWTVSPGEQVARGEVIGYVGSTGWSTGCHLHYTVLANGVAVDPTIWL